MYTIKSQQTKPHDNLKQIVKKHLQTQWQKPVSDLQREIFNSINEKIKSQPKKIILDSGCGAGRSTEILAEKHPDHWVIGIDKSLSRLEKNKNFRDGSKNKNMILVRADVIDFWRQIIASDWSVGKHFILYPNPYPKKSQLTKRWHGHAIFPVLMQTAMQFELRSNWHLYLQEFEQAATIIYPDCNTKIQKLNPNQQALTAFEHKYFAAKQPCYSLRLTLR